MSAEPIGRAGASRAEHELAESPAVVLAPPPKPRAGECCTPAEQSVCCTADAKESCCSTVSTGSCGCR